MTSRVDHPPPSPEQLRMTRLVRSCVIVLLAAVVIFSRTIAVPALAAVVLSIALFSVVNRLVRLGLPRPLAAAIVLFALVGLCGGALYAVRQPLLQLAARGPELVATGHTLLQKISRHPVKAASERQSALVQEVVARQGEQSALADVMAPVARTLTTSLLAAGTSLVLCYFILTCGTSVGRAALGAMRARSNRRALLRVCGSIRVQAAHYLQIVTAINVTFGIATGVTLALLGVDDAMAYGVIAGLMNFIPILGALITTCVLLAGGLAEHGTVPGILLPPAMFLALHLLESQFVTPQFLGRRLLLNPLIIIAGVLVGAAAWGAGGAFLAVPILTAVKLALDANPDSHRWGQVLGRGALIDSQSEEMRRARLRRRPRDIMPAASKS
jgi:predicted PurR-regulated permease PerM